jgi:hypothetical protein
MQRIADLVTEEGLDDERTKEGVNANIQFASAESTAMILTTTLAQKSSARVFSLTMNSPFLAFACSAIPLASSSSIIFRLMASSSSPTYRTCTRISGMMRKSAMAVTSDTTPVSTFVVRRTIERE